MLLESIIPYLPTTITETWIFVGAGLCTVLLVYAVFIEKENRQDLIRLIGAGGLFVYAIYIANIIFVIAMGALVLASLVEFIEIMLGLHTHSPEDLKRYKEMTRTKNIPRRHK
jgi:hypothetical protein